MLILFIRNVVINYNDKIDESKKKRSGNCNLSNFHLTNNFNSKDGVGDFILDQISIR